MKDIYPMWKMCYVFREREMSRNTDHIIDELRPEELSGIALENRIILERAKGKDYGTTRNDLIGAYTHKYNVNLRRDENKVSVDKVRQENPGVVNEAHGALNNCISLKFFTERNGKVFLSASGRMLASEPCWSLPCSDNKENRWNMRLIIEYIKAIGPFWGVIVSVALVVLSFYFGTLRK